MTIENESSFKLDDSVQNKLNSSMRGRITLMERCDRINCTFTPPIVLSIDEPDSKILFLSHVENWEIVND